MSDLGRIPDHLAPYPWYAPHQAWLRENGYPHHDPGDASPARALLVGASLDDASLDDASLDGASLDRARLNGASLDKASLVGASLDKASLDGTCLDPQAPIPDATQALVAAGLAPDADGYVFAWRTRTSRCCGTTTYLPGEYVAPVFSVSPTDCHPGLYFASREWLDRGHRFAPLVQVRVHVSDIHAAGAKFRCRKFTVLPDSECSGPNGRRE